MKWANILSRLGVTSKEVGGPHLSRRDFLRGVGQAAAVGLILPEIARELLVPERTIVLPPAGGWPGGPSFDEILRRTLLARSAEMVDAVVRGNALLAKMQEAMARRPPDQVSDPFYLVGHKDWEAVGAAMSETMRYKSPPGDTMAALRSGFVTMQFHAAPIIDINGKPLEILAPGSLIV